MSQTVLVNHLKNTSLFTNQLNVPVQLQLISRPLGPVINEKYSLKNIFTCLKQKIKDKCSELLNLPKLHWLIVGLEVYGLVQAIIVGGPIAASVVRMMIKGNFKGIFPVMIGGVKGIFGYGGKMMKAPGTAGAVRIPRAAFEAAPKAYFQGLRAGAAAAKLVI